MPHTYPKFFPHDSLSLSQEVPGTMLQAPQWLKGTLAVGNSDFPNCSWCSYTFPRDS